MLLVQTTTFSIAGSWWQSMLLVVPTTTFVLLAADGRICYLCYKPPYLPEHRVEPSALHCLMIEKALHNCFHPCWPCIKITVFVWLLQLTSHWIDIFNILYWKTLHTTIKPLYPYSDDTGCSNECNMHIRLAQTQFCSLKLIYIFFLPCSQHSLLKFCHY